MLFALLLAGQPDLDALAAAAAAARKRFESGAATWTATHTLENGAAVDVHVARHGERASVVLKAGGNDLGRLLVRDGLWHVLEAGDGRKHRPYEAAFALPTWYLYLQAAEPVFLDDPGELRGLPFDGVAEGVGTWRQPLPAATRELALKSGDPKLRELAEKGLPFRVRIADGLKVEVHNPKLRTSIRDLTIHEKPDERLFALPAREWRDFSDDPTSGKLENLVMLAHSAVWQKGQKAGDMNLGLMDVETGRFRRVPFQGAALLPGSFSPDRRKVYGTDARGLYEIDLSSGANRLMAEGTFMFPTSNGTTIAALRLGGGATILESRVALVEVGSGDVRHVGASADRAFLSWLPDGLLLLEREWKDPKEPAIPWICRMDLEGKVTRLRRGNQPALLGQTILYEDNGLWHTCDLSGRGEKLFGDGRRHHILPSPSPDGKRLLMLRRRAADGPEPVVIDLASGRERPVPITPGLWGQPAWR